jgi:RNA polymerase sigma-70 factor (ECF subfamily)
LDAGFGGDERFEREDRGVKYQKMTDNQLVEKALDGDEEAFVAIVKIYLKPVYNFVYRFVWDRDTSEDLTQITFVKVWRNLRRFDKSKNLRTWIFAIAKNTTFDWLKKKKELPFSSFADEEGNNALENISGSEDLPDEIIARTDLAETIDRILRDLPPHYRALLLLHYKEDFTLHEIAEILGEPYNTVKSRHARGLASLKKIIT